MVGRPDVDVATTRHRWKELRDLLCAWDPIGVMGGHGTGHGTGAPRDEYDCVMGPLHQQLARGRSEREIADFLGAYASDHFGIADDLGRSTTLARDAVAWYAKWQSVPLRPDRR